MMCSKLGVCPCSACMGPTTVPPRVVPAFRGMWVAETAGKVKKIVQILDQEVAATALPKAATT